MNRLLKIIKILNDEIPYKINPTTCITKKTTKEIINNPICLDEPRISSIVPWYQRISLPLVCSDYEDRAIALRAFVENAYKNELYEIAPKENLERIYRKLIQVKGNFAKVLDISSNTTRDTTYRNIKNTLSFFYSEEGLTEEFQKDLPIINLILEDGIKLYNNRLVPVETRSIMHDTLLPKDKSNHYNRMLHVQYLLQRLLTTII